MYLYVIDSRATRPTRVLRTVRHYPTTLPNRASSHPQSLYNLLTQGHRCEVRVGASTIQSRAAAHGPLSRVQVRIRCKELHCWYNYSTDLCVCVFQSGNSMHYAYEDGIDVHGFPTEGHVRFAGTALGSCYAMSGTEIAHAATDVRARYAESGTNIAYAAPRSRVVSPAARKHFRVCSPICLRAGYAVCGTEIAYGATDVRY
eukprot:456607-Rhodomonas_salina.1